MSLDPDIQFNEGDDFGWKVECALVQYLRDLDLKNDLVKTDSIGRKVYSRLFSDGAGITYPAIEVSEEGMSESFPDATDLHESVVYPFMITIVDKFSERRHDRKRIFKKWRGTIVDRLQRKLSVVGVLKDLVPEIYDVQVSPRQIFARDSEFMHVFSNIGVEITIRRQRG